MAASPDHNSTASRLYAGISFRPEVLQYLDVLAAQAGTSRSWMLNTIVLEHVKSNAALPPSLLSKETVIQL